MLSRWLQQLIATFVLGFIMRQITKWRNNIDWDLVRADFEARIRAFVYWDMFDDTAVAIMHSILNAAEAALSATADIERILKLASEQKFQEALLALKDLILRSWKPETQVEKDAYACIECFEPIV